MFCAILVVSIHTSPLIELNENVSYILCGIIARIAVPFFLCTMGYYYINGLMLGKNVFKKTLTKLTSVYLIWSVFYISYDLINYIRNDISIIDWMKKTALGLFITGSWEHFWFFPATIFCIIIVTAFYKIKSLNLLFGISLVLLCIGIIGVQYYKIGIEIPIIGRLYKLSYFTAIRRIFMFSLPFFVMGYPLNKITETIKHKKFLKRNLYFILFPILLLFFVESLLCYKFKLNNGNTLCFSLYPLMIIIMLILFTNPLSRHNIFELKYRGLSNFIYYSHPLTILLLKVIFSILFNERIPNTLLFIVVIIIDTLCFFMLKKTNNKYLAMLYK